MDDAVADMVATRRRNGDATDTTLQPVDTVGLTGLYGGLHFGGAPK
jgi:hypothetical protein